MSRERPIQKVSPLDAKRRDAQREGEARRREFLASLDPRQRADLAWEDDEAK